MGRHDEPWKPSRVHSDYQGSEHQRATYEALTREPAAKPRPSLVHIRRRVALALILVGVAVLLWAAIFRLSTNSHGFAGQDVLGYVLTFAGILALTEMESR